MNHNSHILTAAIAGIAFGTAVVAWPFYVSSAERGREIAFLRGAYFTALGLAQVASETADHANDMARAYAVEVVSLRRERAVDRLTQRVRVINRNVPASRIARGIVASAEKHGLDLAWWAGQVEQESRYEPCARGAAGEKGLAQILPSTASELGLNRARLCEIEYSLNAGASYMAAHMRTHGSVERALLRYNGGGEYAGLVRNRAERIRKML